MGLLDDRNIKKVLIDLEIKNRKELKQAISDANKEVDKLKLNTKKWGDEEKNVLANRNKLNATLKQSNTEIDQMSKETKTFGSHFKTAFKNAFSLEKILNRMAFVITAKLSYELFQIAQDSMKAIITNTIKWEEEMSKVYSLLDKTEDKYRGLMDENVLRLMVQYGQTLEESVRAVYDTLSARFDPEDVGVITEASATLAIAEFTDIRTATDLLTTTLNSFNLEASESDRIINLLSQTITDAKSTIAEMGPNFGKIAASASALNLSLEDTVALFSLLTIKGIKTDVAITAIRQLMFTLAAPTEKAKKAMNEYGVELDLNRIKAEGFKVILEELKGADEDFLFTLVKTRRGAQALLPMLNSGSMFMEILGNQTDGTTAAFDKFNERKDTVAQSLKELKGSMFELSVVAKDELLPALKGIVGVLKFFVELGKDSVAVFDHLATQILSFVGYLGIAGLVAEVNRLALLGIGQLEDKFSKEGIANAKKRLATDKKYWNEKGKWLGMEDAIYKQMSESERNLYHGRMRIAHEEAKALKELDEKRFDKISKAKEEYIAQEALYELNKSVADAEYGVNKDANKYLRDRINGITDLISKYQSYVDVAIPGSDEQIDKQTKINKLISEMNKLMVDFKPINLGEAFDKDAGSEYLDILGATTNQIYKMVTAGKGIGEISKYIRELSDYTELSKEQIDELLELLLRLIDEQEKVEGSTPDPKKWYEYGAEIVNVFSNIASAAQSIFEMMSAGIEDALDKDIAKLNDLEAAEIARAENVGLQTENIQNRYDNKRAQAQEKADKEEEKARAKVKPFMVAEALASAYLAANKAFADPGGVIGAILGGTLLAAGLANAAQIAEIQFEHGGMIKGPSHKQGGVPFSVGGRVGFEAEGGEYIVNKQSTSLYLPLLEAINGMQQPRFPQIVQKQYAVGGGVSGGGYDPELASTIKALGDKIEKMEVTLNVSGRQAGTLTNAGNKHLKKTRPQ